MSNVKLITPQQMKVVRREIAGSHFPPEVAQSLTGILDIVEELRRKMEKLGGFITANDGVERTVGIEVVAERKNQWELVLAERKTEAVWRNFWRKLEESTELHIGRVPRPYCLVGRTRWQRGVNSQVGGFENTTDDFLHPWNVARATYYTPDGGKAIIPLIRDHLPPVDQERIRWLLQETRTPLELMQAFEREFRAAT